MMETANLDWSECPLVDEKATAPMASAAAGKPLALRIREIWADIPDEVRAKLPADGASQHDHYIYGAPKRAE